MGRVNRRTWQKVEDWWARYCGLKGRAAGKQGDLGSDVVALGHRFAYEVKCEAQGKARSSFSWAFVREAMIQARVNAARHADEDGYEYLPAVTLVRLPGRGRPMETFGEHAVVIDITVWRWILDQIGDGDHGRNEDEND